MSEERPADQAPDIEYDLAHEWVEGNGAAAASGGQGVPNATGAVYVATETPSYHGDYSYDLAHEISNLESDE